MMVNGWQTVMLGEILTERRETPSPEKIEAGEISIVSKIGFNEGKIELRSETSTKTGMILIRPGDLVISGINAVKGAIAIYSETALQPIAATIHYGAYIPNKERVDIKYLWWFLRSAAFRDIVQHHIPGGIKTELKAKRFLAVPVSLPPFTEQRRILRRIEALAGRVAEAQSLRKEISKDLDAFVSSYHVNYSAGRIILLKDILFLDEEKETIQPDGIYPQVGVKGFGKGLFARETLTGTQTTYKWFNRLYYGAIVLSQVKGWEGAIGVCDESLVGKFVSPEYRIFRCVPDQAIPEYLSVLFSTPYFYSKLKDLSRGVGGRRERVRPELFIELEIPMPDIQRQRKAIEIFSKFPKLHAAQVETGKELSALMPSILDKAFKGEL
jgi:type I restriction enzyme, S subunit